MTAPADDPRVVVARSLAAQIRSAWESRPATGDFAILAILAAMGEVSFLVVRANEHASARHAEHGETAVTIAPRRALARSLSDVAPELSAALAAASPDGDPWIVVHAFQGLTAGPARGFGIALNRAAEHPSAKGDRGLQ